MRLTDLKLKSIRFDGTQRKIFDDSLPNFGIRVYKSGISFVVMLGDRRQMRTLGKYPAMSLKNARSAALRALDAHSLEPSTLLVSEALMAFISASEAKNKPRTTKDYKRLLNKHLPNGKLADMNRKSMLAYLHTLKHTPAEQSHAVTATNVFLNHCVSNGWIDFNPILGIKGLGKIEKRDRILDEKELKSVFTQAMEHPYPFGPIVALCLLTGLRRGEVAQLDWSFFKDNTITIPSELAKNKKEYTFPYSTLTNIVLDTLPNREGLLFAGRSGTGFNGWGNAKKRFDKTIDIKHYTLHDLRRTFASNHARLGTPIHVVEKLLNHVSGSFAGVAGIYNRYSYQDEMKDACIKYEEWLTSLCLGKCL